jgi:hypothetical protein
MGVVLMRVLTLSPFGRQIRTCSARLPIELHHLPCSCVEYQNAHRGCVDESFQVGLGPPFFAVSAGVGNGHCRLCGEHFEGLLVVKRELPPVFLPGKVDVAAALVAGTDLRSKEGLDGRVVLGDADRAGVGGDVRQPNRAVDLVQVSEHSTTAGPAPDPLALLRSYAGGNEVPYTP